VSRAAAVAAAIYLGLALWAMRAILPAPASTSANTIGGPGPRAYTGTGIVALRLPETSGATSRIAGES